MREKDALLFSLCLPLDGEPKTSNAAPHGFPPTPPLSEAPHKAVGGSPPCVPARRPPAHKAESPPSALNSLAASVSCRGMPRDAAIMHKRPWRGFPCRRRPRLPPASSVLPSGVSRDRPYPLLLKKTHGGTRRGPPPGQAKACLNPLCLLLVSQARRAGAESLWAAYSPPPHLLPPLPPAQTALPCALGRPLKTKKSITAFSSSCYGLL